MKPHNIAINAGFIMYVTSLTVPLVEIIQKTLAPVPTIASVQVLDDKIHGFESKKYILADSTSFQNDMQSLRALYSQRDSVMNSVPYHHEKTEETQRHDADLHWMMLLFGGITLMLGGGIYDTYLKLKRHKGERK